MTALGMRRFSSVCFHARAAGRSSGGISCGAGDRKRRLSRVDCVESSAARHPHDPWREWRLSRLTEGLVRDFWPPLSATIRRKPFALFLFIIPGGRYAGCQ